MTGIADALELGALRREPINLPEKQKQRLKENSTEEVPLYVSENSASGRGCFAKKQHI